MRLYEAWDCRSIIIYVLAYFHGNGKEKIMLKRKVLCLLTSLILLVSVASGCKSAPKGTNDENKSSEQTMGSTGEADNTQEPEKKTILLLGLTHEAEAGKQDVKLSSRPLNEFRSLLIYMDGKDVEKKELKDSIIAPYGDKFLELRNDSFILKQENAENNVDDFYLKYSYFFSSGNIISNVLGQKKTPLYTEKTFKEKYNPAKADWPFQSYVEWPWYIGNKYACILNDSYETGGGTFRSGRNEIRMFDISALGKLESRDKTKKLYDLLDKSVQQELLKFADNKNKELKSQQQKQDNDLVKESRKVDLDNLSMVRKGGKWILQIPVYEDYQHEGNGSSFYSITEYIPYECNLPASLTVYDKLCVSWDQVVKAVPQAVDAFSSPQDDLLIVTTPDKLLVFKDPKEGLDKQVMTVQLEKNERVVLNQWAVNTYADKWESELGKYFR